MHPVVWDAGSGRAFRDVLRSQVRNWLRRRAHPVGRVGNETRASDDTPLASRLHVRETNGPFTTIAYAAGNPEVKTITHSTHTSTAEDSRPSTTSSGIVPAVIAVAVFVVCVFVILRILRAIRLNRLVAAYTAEPQTPRMWEVRPHNATGSSFKGKWSEIMPLAAQRSPQCDTGSRLPLSRGMSVSTDVSGSQTSRRDSGDSSSRLLPLTFRKSAVSMDEDYVLSGQVAVLIAMPTPNRPTSTHREQPGVVGPICLGVVDM
ncbi:hypothetical protein LXA43DRAFT_380130 [Ganoderma leucocontextum]|nr:hypothetical protein LXA43DRAFT_380130 [Ganoderma leucocontextum]